MAIKRLVLLALASMLIACSSNDEKVLPPAELIDFKAEVTLKTLWSENVGNGQGDIYNRLQPVVSGGLIYAAANSGDVVALNKTKGRRVWSLDLDTELSGGVSVADSRLFVAAVTGDVIALNSDNGSEVWRHNVGAEVLSPVAANASVAVVQTLDGRLIGLDASSGEEKWEFATTVPVLTMRSVSTPLLINDTVVAGFSSGKAVALDANDGKIRWERRVAIPKGRSELDRIVDIDGSLLYRNDLVYAASYQGNAMAIEPSNGRVIWSEPASSYNGLANGFGNIYISDAEGSVIALAEANGDIRWQRTELARRRLSDPAAISSYVVVGDFEGYVHFLSQVDGHMAGRIRIDGDGVRAPMLVDGDVLYVFGNSGRLAALKVK